MPPVKRILLFLFCIALNSCDSSNSETVGIAGCEVEQQNRFVHEVLQEYYLWYEDIIGTVDYSAHTSPQQTLEFLIDRGRDRFSGIDNAADFDSLFQAGQYLGYGFSYTIKEDGRVWIQFIYDDSPTGRSLIQRGDEILSINGSTVQTIIDTAAWGSVFGPDAEGHPLQMQLRNKSGALFDVNLAKTIVNINTVLHHSLVNDGSDNVGYLVYKSFLSTSNTEFPAVFNDFKAANIRKLILDLRYNGGGSVSVATDLASYVYADENSTDLFAKLVHNSKRQSSNSFFYLKSALNDLNLDQLIVITSAATCSASEMIINGLRPFIDVKTVGDTTCGKPVGMNGFRFCGNILLPVSFEIRNQNDEGAYFDGIPPDCVVQDDVSFLFGNVDEPMLREALFLSNQNRCQSPLRAAKRKVTSNVSRSILRDVIGAY